MGSRKTQKYGRGKRYLYPSFRRNETTCCGTREKSGWREGYGVPLGRKKAAGTRGIVCHEGRERRLARGAWCGTRGEMSGWHEGHCAARGERKAVGTWGIVRREGRKKRLARGALCGTRGEKGGWREGHCAAREKKRLPRGREKRRFCRVRAL